jgi:beta-lactam-binding protein with PASTA domain
MAPEPSPRDSSCDDIAMDDPERRMPKVWNLSVEDAQTTLTVAGLPFVLRYAPNLIIPEGSMIAVSPRPDTVLTVDSEITLTISSGPPRVVEEL